MTDALAQSVVDTLLPGDAVLPSGTAAGVTLSPQEKALSAFAAHAGAGAFLAATPAERAGLMRRFAAHDPAAFRALLMPLLQDYYDSDVVLDALGWRREPPQPRGHDLPTADAETMALLDAVRRRGPIWRRG